MRTKLMIAATAALMTIAGSAFAGSSAASQQELERLEKAKNRLATGSRSVKPNQAMRMQGEADKLQGLIDEIESGKQVDSGTVDRAIKRSRQGF